MGWTQEVSNCSELKHLCDLPEARLLRMVCGSTCGCTDPLSQPFHKVGTWIFMGKTGRLWYDHFIILYIIFMDIFDHLRNEVVRGGCTDSCLKLGEQALENVECNDQPPGDLAEPFLWGPARFGFGWIWWLPPASAQVSVGGSSGTPIQMLCPTFLVIICHFSEDSFFLVSNKFLVCFFLIFVGMFVFGQGFDEQLLRPKQPKQQGFFVGDQGQERWCILRSYPWWQRWKSEDVLVCKIPLCSLHLCMKLKDECRNFTWTLTCSKAWWWCANCSLSCRFCCSNSVACSDLGRCRALSFHFSVRR